MAGINTVEEYVLRIRADGAKQAQAELATLQRTKRQLEDRKVSIQVELKNIDQELNKWKTAKKELEQQKLQLQIDKGSEEAIERITQDIRKAQNEIKKLEGERLQVINTNDLKKTEGELQSTNQKIRNIKTALKETEATGESAFSKMRQGIYVVGAGLQSFANMMDQVAQSNPFTEIVQSIEGIATGGIMNIITEGLTGITDRYDAMKQYNIMMQAIGASEGETAEMTRKLDESVRGLPTSLDEVMTMAKEFTSTLGDYNKATDYAIAVNNAFLASGTDATTRNQGMLQVRDLLSGKELNTKEWGVLISSISLVKREMGKMLVGDSSEALRQFDKDLRAGKYSADQFLDALVKVTKESPAVQQALMAQKSTFQGVFQNITTAIKRLGADVLEILDEVFKEKTGGTFVYNLGKIIDLVDDLSASLREWVTANKDKIFDFFEKIKGIDWEGIISNLAKFAATQVRVKVGLLDFVSSLPLGKQALAFFATFGTSIANSLRVVGGAFAGLGRILLVAGENKGGGLISKLKILFLLPFRLGKGLLSKVAQIKPLQKAVEKIKGFINSTATVSKVLDKIPKVDFATKVEGFKSFMMGIGKIAGVIGVFAGFGATLKLYVSVVNDISQMQVPDWQKFGKVMAMVGSTLGAISLLGGGLGVAGTTGIGTAIIAMGELATGGLIAVLLEFATTLREYVKALDEIAKLKMPDAEKLDAVVTQINTLNSKMVSISTNINDTIALVQFDAAMKSVASILGNMAKSVATTHELAKENAEKLKEEVDKLSAKDGLFDQVEAEMEQLRQRAVLFMAGFGKQKNGAGLEGKQQSVSEWASGTESTLPHFEAQLNTVVAILEGVKNFTTKIANLRTAITESGIDTDKDLGEGGVLTRHIANMSGFLTRLKPSLEKLIEITEKIGENPIDMTSISSILTTLPTLFTQLSKVKKAMEEQGLTTTENTDGNDQFFEDLEGFLSEIEDLVEEISDISGIITEEGFDAQAITSTLTEITKIISALAEVKSMFFAKGFSSENEDATAFISDLGTMLSDVEDIIDTISGIETEGVVEKAQQLVAVLKEVQTIFSTVNAIQVPTAEEGEATKTEQISTALSTLINNLITSLEKVDELKEKADLIVLACNEIRSAIIGWSGLNGAFENLQGEIQLTLTKLSGLQSSLDLTSGKVNATKTTIDNLKLAIDNLPSEKTISINVYGVDPAVEAVSNLASEIRDLHDKTVNVKVYKEEVGGGVGGGGGFAYAIGGRVRGTDSVSALLTPGEYVHKRSAVKLFGNRFMERVNNLDIKGALRELSVRAGMGVNTTKVSRNTNIHNSKVHNNNATINQYITTNNDKWTYKRANRYARQL